MRGYNRSTTASATTSRCTTTTAAGHDRIRVQVPMTAPTLSIRRLLTAVPRPPLPQAPGVAVEPASRSPSTTSWASVGSLLPRPLWPLGSR